MAHRIDTQALRVRLIERQEELKRGRGSALRDCSDVAGNSGSDHMDQASSAADVAVALGSASIFGEELVAIDEALERLDDGSYGICEDCDEVIGAARLEALPYARYCIDCQRRFESTGRGEPAHSSIDEDW